MIRRHNEFNIAVALSQVRRGDSLLVVAERNGITVRRLSVWLNSFDGLTPAEIREANLLRKENRRLRSEIELLAFHQLQRMEDGAVMSRTRRSRKAR